MNKLFIQSVTAILALSVIAACGPQARKANLNKPGAPAVEGKAAPAELPARVAVDKDTNAVRVNDVIKDTISNPEPIVTKISDRQTFALQLELIDSAGKTVCTDQSGSAETQKITLVTEKSGQAVGTIEDIRILIGNIKADDNRPADFADFGAMPEFNSTDRMSITILGLDDFLAQSNTKRDGASLDKINTVINDTSLVFTVLLEGGAKLNITVIEKPQVATAAQVAPVVKQEEAAPAVQQEAPVDTAPAVVVDTKVADEKKVDEVKVDEKKADEVKVDEVKPVDTASAITTGGTDKTDTVIPEDTVTVTAAPEETKSSGFGLFKSFSRGFGGQAQDLISK